MSTDKAELAQRLDEIPTSMQPIPYSDAYVRWAVIRNAMWKLGEAHEELSALANLIEVLMHKELVLGEAYVVEDLILAAVLEKWSP